MTRSLRGSGPRALVASLLLSSALVGTALAQTKLFAPFGGPLGEGIGYAYLSPHPDEGSVYYEFSYPPSIGSIATAAHIHRGAADTDGPIVFSFESYMSGTAGRYQDVDAGLIREIIANPAGFYVDIHTDSANSALRGQLGQQ